MKVLVSVYVSIFVYHQTYKLKEGVSCSTACTLDSRTIAGPLQVDPPSRSIVSLTSRLCLEKLSY